MDPRTANGHARRLHVTERDVELFLALLRHRYLSIGQLERLFFPSAQTANRRVRLLERGGLVRTFRPPGIGDRLVHPTTAGLDVVAGRLGVPVTELDGRGVRTRPKDYYFLRHHLAAADFRIALTQAVERRADVSLLGYLAEHVGERTPKGGVQKYIRDVVSEVEEPGTKIAHTPDSVFAVSRDGSPALFFVEVDRGTEVIGNPEKGFGRTLRFYLNYLVRGGYRRYEADFRSTAPFEAFRVLVTTTSRRRLENIRSVGGRLAFEPARAKRFIWLAEQEAVANESVLTAPWVSLDPDDTTTYRIIPDERGVSGGLQVGNDTLNAIPNGGPVAARPDPPLPQSQDAFSDGPHG